MDPLYDALPPDTALRVQLAARLSYETRENRRRVLAAMDVADEGALLGRISRGEVAEHPAYEHYLAACILRDTHESTRQLITDALNKANRP
ncbi:hypothetical protein [Accumulibacter sp.]|uniref:hypothetical protein n=1 Tax=Accumulibacter sp. TaxID=2053492 RepID=UPI001A51DDB5|nr:hypothetical protein [Accumulibacter sp.]MBL8375477.1 hypothetical protein [Accumulibacter sp.]